MKLFLIALITALLLPFAAADSLDDVIPAYESYVRSTGHEEAVRLAGESPHTWQDVRPGAVSARMETARGLLRRVEETDTDRVIDKAILLRLLEADIVSAEMDLARIPFTGDWGFQAEPIFAALGESIDSVEEGEAWIDRLNDVPRYFAENVENMRRGIRTGWTAHADPLGTMVGQIREQIVDDPAKSGLYTPFLSLSEDISPAQAERLQAEGLQAVSNAIAAYRDTLFFIETEYSLYTREEAGIGSLPAGRAAYRAAVDFHTAGAGYSPEEIHMLGTSEVTRIRARMDSVIEETGFEGSFKDFLAYLRTDPQFYPETPEELLLAAEEISDRLRAILPDYFGHLPDLDFEVQPVPAAIAEGYTTGRYSSGDAREGRKGIYLVNTYALDQRPLYELPALSAHEAVPGHHIQISLAQEMEAQPDFRREYYATAFGEGWGLYAESIAGEAGIYRTPYERFGALSYEMWRACRLVADTGMHWYGWSREEAEACFLENSALSPLNIRIEVTRYIGWPGQAVAYKVGELKIRELRARAEQALGPAFDLKVFHDVVLGEGALPLDMLEWRVNQWIASQKSLSQPVPATAAN